MTDESGRSANTGGPRTQPQPDTSPGTGERTTSRQLAAPQIARHYLWVPPLLSLAISCVAIAVPSPRWDEAATVAAASRSLPDLFAMLGNIDAVHGLYYLLLHPIMAVFGPSVVVGRLLSALAIAAATAATALLGMRLSSPRLGFTAGVVFALLPVTSHYGMEMRTPAMATAVIAWATYALVILLTDATAHRGRWWIIYTLGMVLASYVFLYSLLILAAHWTTLLIRRPSGLVLRRAVFASVIIVLASVPLLLVAAGQSAQVGWISRPTLTTLIQTAGAWTLPPALNKIGTGLSASQLLVVLLWGIVLLGAVVAWRRRHTQSRAEASTELLFAVAAPWLFLPTAILLVASLVDPLFHRSYVVFSTPAFALLVAYGLLLVTRRALLGVLAAGLIMLAIPTLYSDRQPLAKGNLDLIADVLAQQSQPGDAIVFYKSGGRRMTVLYPETFDPLTDVVLDQTPIEAGDFLGTKVTEHELDSRLDEVDRLWLVSRVRKPLPDWMQRQFAENHLIKTDDWKFGRSSLLLYERE